MPQSPSWLQHCHVYAVVFGINYFLWERVMSSAYWVYMTREIKILLEQPILSFKSLDPLPNTCQLSFILIFLNPFLVTKRLREHISFALFNIRAFCGAFWWKGATFLKIEWMKGNERTYKNNLPLVNTWTPWQNRSLLLNGLTRTNIFLNK